RRLFDRWLGGAAGVVALLVLTVVLTFRNTRQLNEDAHWVAHTHEVMEVLEQAVAHLREAEVRQRNYLLTGDETLRPTVSVSIDDAREAVEWANRLTEDNPAQQARIPDVRKRINDLAGRWSDTAGLRKEQGLDAARRAVAAGE